MESEIIYPNEYDTVDLESWSFPRLVKVDANGNNRYWQVTYEDKKLFKVAGTEKAPLYYETDVEPKGKRNYSQQAFLIAKKEYNDKIKQNYHIEAEGYEERRDIVLLHEPMLAKDYKGIVDFPVAVQPKLDGIRMMAYYDENNELVFSSRGSNNFIYTENHLVGLRKEVVQFLSLLPDGTQLDGELYSNNLSFLEITSIVKTRVRVHKKSDLIQYHMFDIVLQSNPVFEERYEILVDTYNRLLSKIGRINYLEIVETKLVNNQKELDDAYDNYINKGYEGMMIRKVGPGTEYVSGRTSNLLKMKDVFEEEIIVTDLIECKGNEEGLCKIRGLLPNGKSVIVRPSETFETRRMYLENANDYIGKKYTIIYNEINPDTGMPRFPRGKGFRDYE